LEREREKESGAPNQRRRKGGTCGYDALVRTLTDADDNRSGITV
jgi:hypothetical protein